MTDAEMTRPLDYILSILKNLPFEEEEAIRSSDSLDLIIVRRTTHSSDLITEVTEGRDSTPTNDGAHTTR